MKESIDESVSFFGSIKTGAAIVECDESPEDEYCIDDTEMFHVGECTSKDFKAEVKIDDHLNPDQKQQLYDLCAEFRDVFSEKPGMTRIVEHHIDLTTDQPVRAKLYPIPHALREEVNEEVSKMLEMDVIERSESPYAAPVVLVRKKDGTNRFCIDFRQLNRVTVFDAEPMPRTDSIYATLFEDKYLTKIDLCKGYWQIPVVETDRPKTAFRTPDRGCFQFKRMPFGLVNSATTFNRMMRLLLEGLPSVDSYVDDILVHTKTWGEHLSRLRSLFERLRKADIKAKLSKCTFGSRKVEYVGH